jgi:hypothetical protein
MKFRKIEAEQFTLKNKDRVFNWMSGNHYARFEDGVPVLKFWTAHGKTTFARIGDWIVKDEVPGTYYIMKPDIFDLEVSDDSDWCSQAESLHHAICVLESEFDPCHPIIERLEGLEQEMRNQELESLTDEPDMIWDMNASDHIAGDGAQEVAESSSDGLPACRSMLIHVLCAKRLPSRWMKITKSNDVDEETTWEWVSQQQQSTKELEREAERSRGERR